MLAIIKTRTKKFVNQDAVFYLAARFPSLCERDVRRRDQSRCLSSSVSTFSDVQFWLKDFYLEDRKRTDIFIMEGDLRREALMDTCPDTELVEEEPSFHLIAKLQVR